MRADVCDPFAQVANAEEVLDLRAGGAGFLHHLHRLPVGAFGVSGGQPGDERGRDEKAGRVGCECQVPPDHGEGDPAESGADGQRRGPEGILQRGRERVVRFGDEVRQHRLLRRLEEGADQRMRGDDRVGNPRLLRPPDEEQAKHQSRARDVAHDHDRAPGEAICDHARRRTGEEHGHEPGEQGESDRLALPGQLQQEREERDDVEPVAQLRDRVRGVQCAEIAVVPQNGHQASN